MSTVAEIREAISKLNEQERFLLLAQLFASTPQPDDNDPALVAAIDEGLADEAEGRVYSIEEVRAMVPQWISESYSRKEP